MEYVNKFNRQRGSVIMAYKYKKNIANKKNYGYQRTPKLIDWIVVHFTANDGDSDESNAKYFKNNIVKASAHYFIDDDSVTQSVPDNYIAYSVGGNKYPNTKGAKYFSVCNNIDSLNIELCDTVKNGKNDLSAKTRANAVEFIREKAKQYGIDRKHVIRHYDVTGKCCPKYFVEDEKAWNEFLDDIFNSKNKITTDSDKIGNKPNENVKNLQKALNDSYASNLKVDGILGEKTKAILKTHVVKNYTQNAYAKWVQRRLKSKKYMIGVDSKFGEKSSKILKQFQKNNGLTVDGVCGYYTCIKLL